MSINRGLDKQIMMNSYNGTLYTYKKINERAVYVLIRKGIFAK